MKKTWAFCLGVICCFTLSACDDSNFELEQQTHINEFVLSSSAMADGDSLPTIYTCDGDSLSPPLTWHGAPEATKYYALVMHHDAPEGVHWYWTLYDINADTTQVKAGESLGQVGSNSVSTRHHALRGQVKKAIRLPYTHCLRLWLLTSKPKQIERHYQLLLRGLHLTPQA